MNAAADVRLPATLARFADRRQAASLLESVLLQLAGSAGSIVGLEILNSRFKRYLKPSSSLKCCFAVLYRMRVCRAFGLGVADELIYLKAFVAGRSAAEFARHVARGDPAPLHLEQHDALLWRFPDAPGLPQLSEFFGRDGLRAMLAVPLDRPLVTVVNFRPEQRCTLRVRSGGRRAWYVKVYAEDGGRDTFERMSRLARLAARHRLDLVIPPPSHYDEQRRALWLAEVRGEPLEARLLGVRRLAVCRRVGRALAQLHRYADPGAGATEWTPSRLLDELQHKSARLCAADATAASMMAALLQELRSSAAKLVGQSRAAIHGDFHVGQVLVQDRRVVFCDLDELACGNPAQDLANLSVDLWLRAHPRERIDAIEAVVLAAYCAEAACVIGRVDLHWYALIALVNRAYRAYLQQAEDTEQRLARIAGEIERVRDLLRRETGSSGLAEAA